MYVLPDHKVCHLLYSPSQEFLHMWVQRNCRPAITLNYNLRHMNMYDIFTYLKNLQFDSLVWGLLTLASISVHALSIYRRPIPILTMEITISNGVLSLFSGTGSGWNSVKLGMFLMLIMMALQVISSYIGV